MQPHEIRPGVTYVGRAGARRYFVEHVDRLVVLYSVSLDGRRRRCKAQPHSFAARMDRPARVQPVSPAANNPA